MRKSKGVSNGLITALFLSNLVSLVLFALRVLATGTFVYGFMFWNLFLAWLPVLITWLLMKSIINRSWREPQPLLLTFFWLGFLPNSFYLMSDLIHLTNTGEIGILFDAVLFMSFIWNGLVAGMISLIWVHKELIRRSSARFATLVITLVLALNSFAIYLGRNLRWNTWDLLANPMGLLFDVSERIVNPLAHPQAYVTTLTFFVLIGSMYLVVWNFTAALNSNNDKS